MSKRAGSQAIRIPALRFGETPHSEIDKAAIPVVFKIEQLNDGSYWTMSHRSFRGLDPVWEAMGTLGSLRILLVDDHEPVRRGLRSLLSSRTDWSVCGEAVDGLEAVEKAKTLRPNVVLMDIAMPRMNGLDAARIIRREVSDSEVVKVTGRYCIGRRWKLRHPPTSQNLAFRKICSQPSTECFRNERVRTSGIF